MAHRLDPNALRQAHDAFQDVGTADNPEPTLDDLVDYTRETYKGPFQLGEDLISFVIEQDGSVTVQKFRRAVS